MFSFSIKSLLEREEPGSFLPVEGFLEADSVPLGKESLPLRKPISVKGRITKLQDGLIEYRGKESASLTMPCDRCLTKVPVEVEVDSSLRFYTGKGKEILREEDFDAVPIEQPLIELDEVIFHDIQMALPMKVLCREDCKGLCPVCGHHLNEGPCGCEESETDPRWDLLKSFADTLEQEV